MALKAIVLGAGKGTRMKSDLAKVLHPVAGRPMLLWALDVLEAADVDETVVVVGHQADAVRAILPPGVGSAYQAEQLGTGHAVMVALENLEVDPDDDVIVMPGDMPLVRAETIIDMLGIHRSTAAAATMLSVEVDEPGAYGRVIRDGGRVLGIVEAKDATPDQLTINEVGTSVYAFSGSRLRAALLRIGTDNAQGEYYLTDVIGILAGDGDRVEAHIADAEEGLGVNSIEQIADVEAALERRKDIS
jgi:bifunctional UDP-N-acetylglucosamine pyrophosphorylase/glucosamine-1-phosphate N-acetyltransferase